MPKKRLDILSYLCYIRNRLIDFTVHKESTMAKQDKKDHSRMIHIRLEEDIHRLMRIRVAEEDTRIQNWVAALIERELKKGGAR